MANDPLDVIKNARLVPKQRLAITYRGGDWNINNFVFTAKTNDVMTRDMSVANELRTLYASSMGADNNSNYVFASASAEGYISSEVALSPDLCGDTSVMVRKNLLVNSYLVRHDGGTNELYLSVREGDEMSKPIKIPDVVPTYAFSNYYGVEIALDMGTAHDIAAFDWNGDGYADYLLSFCTTAGDGEVYTRLLLVDGKSLYEKSKNSSAEAPKYYYVNGGGTAVGVRSMYFTTGIGYRMALGDFDGDGEAEAAIYFPSGTDDLNNINNGKLEVYKIKTNNDGGFAFSQIYTEDTKIYPSLCYVGLATGDINGDGRDELALLTPVPDSGTVWAYMIKINVYQWKGGAFAKTVDSAPTGVAIMSPTTTSFPSVNAAIADLDGDGLGELVWTLPDFTEDSEFQLKLYVNDWNLQKGADVTGAGAQYGYNLHDDGIGWSLDFNYIHHSLCTGRFFEPKVNNSSIRCSQIAVGHMGGKGNVDVGVFSWYAGSLQLEGKGWYQGVMMQGNMGPIVQAVDLYDESLIVGAPTVVTVEDNIELFMVTQAPPKHWDRVRAAGSALSGYAEEDGKVTLDSFAVFDTEGYYTGMQLNKEWGKSSSTTTANDGKFGASVGAEASHRGTLMDAVFHRTESYANEDPLIDFAIEGGGEWVDAHTAGYSSTLNGTFSYKADRDDQLYYRANDYNICRYPVIFPESRRYVTVSDDKGAEYKAQNYIQYIVPTETASTFTPTPGRSVSWYEPLHDNYNLFTYPKRLIDITGYPQGRDKKISINKNDPLADVNGEVFVTGSGNVIGNLDASEFHLDASASSSDTDLNSVRGTVGAHTYIHPTVGKHLLLREITIKVDLEGDYTYTTDSTTTTNASEMYGMTMAWPGARSYTMYTDNWSAADMQFKSDAAYFTQDDGAFCVGYAVPELESFQSKIWGPGSPYETYADPGLLLPFRWNNDIKNKSAGQNLESMVYYLAENDNPNTSHQMRGLSFERVDNGAPVTTGAYQGTATKLLECGQKYNLRLRVINYSFVNTREVKVRFYYQPWTEGGTNYPAANPATDGGCEEITGGNPAAIKSISGRTGNSEDSGDNWDYAVLKGWTAPTETGLGWLHAVISYDGEQLSADNDHGYVLVGSYDPQDFFGTVSAQAANVARAASVSVESYPDIAITGVTAYEMAKDGTVSQEPLTIDEKSRSKKMKIDIRVKYTGGRLNIGGKEKEINYVPLLRVGLLAGKRGVNRSLLGATEFPLIRAGEERTFSFVYDPKNCDYNYGVAVRAFSPYLFASEQRDPRSQYKVLWNSIENNGGGGSGGGCGVGLGALALLALLPLAWRKKR
ncbi:FG-GAP repeat domain-containing protein [Cloacibacillus sp.]